MLPGGDLSMTTEIAMTLNESVKEAKAWDSTFTEIRPEPGQWRFVPEGIRYEQQLIRMAEDDRIRLFNKIGAPGNYLKDHPWSLQAEVLAEHAKKGDFG